MSRGIGAFMEKVLEDDELVIYQYGSENLNEKQYRNEQKIADGVITVHKKCFVEPEFHDRIKRMPGGRKRRVMKRVPVPVDYGQYLKEGTVIIENTRNCWWKSPDGYDVSALQLLYCLFRDYQAEGSIPEYCGYFT